MKGRKTDSYFLRPLAPFPTTATHDPSFDSLMQEIVMSAFKCKTFINPAKGDLPIPFCTDGQLRGRRYSRSALELSHQSRSLLQDADLMQGDGNDAVRCIRPGGSVSLLCALKAASCIQPSTESARVSNEIPRLEGRNPNAQQH